MKKLKYVIIPLVLCGVMLFGFNKYMDKKDTQLLENKDLYMLLHDAVSLVKDKGVFANNYLMKNGYMMVMGSSELSHSTRQHPDYYFNTGRTKNKVITVGRAYTQTLQDATILGSLNNDIKDKKVVLLLSMQWFMERGGVTPHHFQTRFSPIQFYRFMENPKISDELKDKYVARVDELLNKPGEFKPEALYAKLYMDKSLKGKMMRTLFKPYYFFRRSMVALKDKGITMKKLEEMYNKDEVNYNIRGKIDWKKEMSIAKKEAETRVGKKVETLGGKRLYIDKGYYREYIRGKDKKFRGIYNYVKLDKAREFEDFEIFLETCKDLNIEPTIVLLPGMNEFYNYTGISQKERKDFFDKTKSIIKPYGFRVIDLSKNENKRYYLRDVMHLGTIGWVDLCQKLYNIYER